MWDNLPQQQRKYYQRLITNFSSLSEAFAQKSESDELVAPIVNSKYQETAFQHAFNAIIEDIANTSYDASIQLLTGEKYIVGIKSFGLESGAQKIAQFKRESQEWVQDIALIRKNAEQCTTKEEIDTINNSLYLKLATNIAILRNRRIASSVENLKGFSVHEDSDIESVYHVLMPSKKGDTPTIYVGETNYHMISIEDIKILGCTSMKNPSNFSFLDMKSGCEYKYTAADSQLYMKFNNRNIIKESWPVNYVEDAFTFFENLDQQVVSQKKYESYSWKIKIQPYSGYNAFYGVGSKLGKDTRQERIDRILSSIENQEYQDYIKSHLEYFLLRKDTTAKQKERIRDELMQKVMYNESLRQEIAKLVYRPMDEMYIPIPNAKKFHQQHPNFFGPLSKTGSSQPFTLTFQPSGDSVKAQVRQQAGKAIQSIGNQGILGQWILRKVFQLAPYEPLTEKRLEEVGINAIRLTKKMM